MAATQDTAVKETSAKKNGGAVANELEDGWVELAVDRPMYKPDTCRKTPLRGRLINLVSMPETDNGPWNAYVIKTTKPCLAVDGFDDSDAAKEYPAGTEVLLTETVKLKGELSKLLNPDFLIEVEITPTEKVKIGGGRTMWRYSIRANHKSVAKRPAIYALNSVTTAPARQLAAGGGGTESDEIPF